MATKNIEVRDSEDNIYYFTTKANLVKYKDTNIEYYLPRCIISTNTSIDYYISPTGNDSDIGSKTSPFKTVQHALDMLPKFINHTVNINIDGNFDENINIIGFQGKGYIFINGGNSSSITTLTLSSSSLSISINNLILTGTSRVPIFVSYCLGASISSCNITNKYASQDGIRIESSIIRLSNCTISDRDSAIASYNGSTVYSFNNTGTNNKVGLKAYSGGTIAKDNATQPAGTTAELITTGGAIR